MLSDKPLCVLWGICDTKEDIIKEAITEETTGFSGTTTTKEEVEAKFPYLYFIFLSIVVAITLLLLFLVFLFRRIRHRRQAQSIENGEDVLMESFSNPVKLD